MTEAEPDAGRPVVVDPGGRFPVGDQSRMPAGALDAPAAWLRLLDVRAVSAAEEAGLRRGPVAGWEWAEPASMEATQLADLYAPLCLAGPGHVFAQLGQSLDGFIATRTGDACFVTGEEDRRHLHRLRALADAVVVGAATALADDPQLTVRAVSGRNPVRVVLDPRGRVPADRRMFTDEASPTLWLLGAGTRTPGALASQVDVLCLPLDSAGRLAPRQVLDALATRGLGRVLVEGGGVTVSRFLAARALSRLYLTVAQVLVGDGVPGIRFPGEPLMRDAVRPPTRRFDLGEDVLFELDLTAGPLAREMPEIVD